MQPTLNIFQLLLAFFSDESAGSAGSARSSACQACQSSAGKTTTQSNADHMLKQLIEVLFPEILQT